MHTFRRLNPALAATLRYIEAGADGEAATATPTTSTGTTDTSTQTPQGAAGAEATTDGDQPDETLGEPGKKALQAEREAKKAAEQSAKDAQAALAAEQRQHTAAKERITALEAELATVKDQAATASTAARERDVLKALYEFGVPAEHRHLVKGDTAEELMDAAKSVATLAGRPDVVPQSGSTSGTVIEGSVAEHKRRIKQNRT